MINHIDNHIERHTINNNILSTLNLIYDKLKGGGMLQPKLKHELKHIDSDFINSPYWDKTQEGVVFPYSLEGVVSFSILVVKGEVNLFLNDDNVALDSSLGIKLPFKEGGIDIYGYEFTDESGLGVKATINSKGVKYPGTSTFNFYFILSVTSIDNG